MLIEVEMYRKRNTLYTWRRQAVQAVRSSEGNNDAG
jgi:hypothetical protein